MKFKHISCRPAVNESERKALEHIKGPLINEPGDGEWILLTNLPFSATNHRQFDEIDIVAIGPPGVRVIEVKHWTATWVKRNSELVEHQADRVTDKARRIGTKLRRQVESLPRVDGVFLVTEATPKVAALEDREPVRGVPFHTFKSWRDAVGFHAKPALSPQQIQGLAQTLWPRSAVAVDGTLKRLSGYGRLELLTPPDQRFHRKYKATHTSRQERVILHLYDLSAGDAKAAEKAEREWKSLQRLQYFSWAPRIVDSFQDAPGYPGEIKFFTEADPAAPSIEKRTRDNSWDPVARSNFARAAVRALTDLHESGGDGEPMVHRNLTPGTILVKHDNSPILTGFEYARIPGDVSVASSEVARDGDPAAAPEVRAHGRGAADPRSDVYSLCASLTVLFKGREDETSTSAAEILTSGIEDEPQNRGSLSELETRLSELLGERSTEPPSPPPARFWTEGQVVAFGGESYRIVSRIGSGGVGTTFKVVQVDRTQGELGTYVAKVVRNEETGQRVLDAHKLVRSHLSRSTSLSTIFEVAAEWRENSFVALLAWVEGEPLSEYLGVMQPDSDEVLARKWLRTACEALGVLHSNGLVHGDISPRNILVSESGIVLTDYDFVTKIGERADAPGTVAYCPLSFGEGRVAAPSDDLYALAASFFHVLFERESFQYNAKERGLNWAGVERGDYPLLAEFLDRATHPDPGERFANAADALAMLSPSGHEGSGSEASEEPELPDIPDEVNEEPTERQEREVGWLKSLLQSYPGSQWGNRETRGLDTKFAAQTYVETDLEETLYRDVVERRVSLVVLCGNAGDGKTALLQRLAKRLGLGVQTSATRIVKGRSRGGSTVRMNLDGSASWQGRSADELLNEFLAPFQDGRPEEDIVHLLAINDGRLIEWVESVQQEQGETPLTEHLSALLENDSPPTESHICLVDLNQRSLVGRIAADRKTVDTGFLDRLVDRLYGGERSAETWAPCRTCSAQERCEVFRAAKCFGPGDLSKEIVRKHGRERLFEALQAVHLRGETHITVRELRAALVYILFGVHYCTDYHDANNGSGTPGPQPYWERAFSPSSMQRQGEVLGELPRFDPALEAQPQVDRYLLHPPPGDGMDGINNLLKNGGSKSLESLRRRAYFELSPEKIESLTDDPRALGLAYGRHLRQFQDIALDAGNHERAELTKRLCGGISRLEALPPKALDRADTVPLRVTPRTPTETAFWVEKSIDDFRLEPDLPKGGEGLERLHRQAFLIYRYRDGGEERLRLGADLFHLLLELNEGYQLGDAAAEDKFAHLSIFVQRLVREDHRRMLAWNPMCEDNIFEVAAQIHGADSKRRQRLAIAPLRPPGETHAE